tara:strand:+ start:311 stop:475 length:165 start_codon:yes stop_codon:yes gene_type:complete
MQEQTENTTEINELTYEQWKKISDKLDEIQARLDNRYGNNCCDHEKLQASEVQK